MKPARAPAARVRPGTGRGTSRPATRREDELERIRRHWHEAVPNDRMAHLVKDATRGFLRALQGRLAEHDIPLGHWAFLRVLWERDGLTQRELSIEAGVMEPTTLAALRAMETVGLIRREHRAGNRKNMYVFLTREGRRLRKVLVPLAEQVNAVALRGLSETDIATTRWSLLAMIDNLGRDEGALPASPRA